ncbi:GNAT family N-acetyltransferase [Paenibacillus sp. PR3]|uniref:GNAT family N-acetyltransferase n=1 Tax=Paenibacillus terricola TaxID=2763503 RepID=A0ABR8N0E3_9BACL|nr:GNAT family N-acetyltransferase [Paenibacillus terricola]MBD3921665.1 GNAT family N-acetyltransferase [Paenibacillus terricola]
MIAVLPDRWGSNNLAFLKISENEIREVRFYLNSQSINLWDGNEYNANQIEHWIRKGDLPPEGNKQNYRLFTVRRNSRNEIIGILSVYHGYPRSDSAYLVFLYISREQQGLGFGQEAVSQLCIELKKRGYKEIRANVAVRNWPAIRFWTKAGFNGISGIYGDKVHSDSTYANLELFKLL